MPIIYTFIYHYSSPPLDLLPEPIDGNFRWNTWDILPSSATTLWRFALAIL
jgi:hypothetical protein